MLGQAPWSTCGGSGTVRVQQYKKKTKKEEDWGYVCQRNIFSSFEVVYYMYQLENQTQK